MKIDLAFPGIGLFHAEKLDLIDIVGFVFGIDDRAVRREEHWRHLLAGSALFSQTRRVVVGETLTQPLFRSQIAEAEADREFEDNDRIGPETTEDGRYGRIKAGQYRSHPNDCAGSDDDSQDRQEGAHLVGADGLKGERCAVDKGEPAHSIFPLSMLRWDRAGRPA